jgi:hypothetical protein
MGVPAWGGVVADVFIRMWGEGREVLPSR